MADWLDADDVIGFESEKRTGGAKKASATKNQSRISVNRVPENDDFEDPPSPIIPSSYRPSSPPRREPDFDDDFAAEVRKNS
jgi:hypothetical protein